MAGLEAIEEVRHLYCEPRKILAPLSDIYRRGLKRGFQEPEEAGSVRCTAICRFGGRSFLEAFERLR